MKKREMPCESCKRVKDPERCFKTQECDDWMAWFRAEWQEIRSAAYSCRRGEETCISCGATIPEGRQICPACEKRAEDRKD